jgi:D-sedoheptulose 7-phosphate isomerase
MIIKRMDEHISVIESIKNESARAAIAKAAELCRHALVNGKKILFCGNGGSAADCQHLAAEIVGRFVKERPGMPAIALTTDTSILTAIANDYGYDSVFARQVEALCYPGDVVFGLSTSGNSNNVILALEKAAAVGAATVGMTGKDGGKMKNICDVNINIPTNTTARVQEAHIMIGHIICELIEAEI